MSAIRRANPESKIWRDHLSELSSDRIGQTSVSSTTAQGLFPEYPYSDQEVLTVEFVYLLDRPRSNESTPIDMRFYYRTQSDLWILDPGPRDNLADEVVQELKIILGDYLSILPGISVSKRGLWNFIESASVVHEVIVRHDFQDVSWTEIEDLSVEKVVGNKLVTRADLEFEYEGENIDVIFSNDNLSINSDGEIGFEYIVQQFEWHAIYQT